MLKTFLLLNLLQIENSIIAPVCAVRNTNSLQKMSLRLIFGLKIFYFLDEILLTSRIEIGSTLQRSDKHELRFTTVFSLSIFYF